MHDVVLLFKDTQCYERERMHGLAGDLRGRVVVAAATAHLAVRECERECAIFSLQLLAALAQASACRLEVFVRGEVRLYYRSGFVLRYCTFEFFYSSF